MPHINTGQRIHVETGNFKFSRDADTPGLVRVVGDSHWKGAIDLPANRIDAERFIEAYRIAVEADVEYRTIEWKNAKVNENAER